MKKIKYRILSIVKTNYTGQKEKHLSIQIKRYGIWWFISDEWGAPKNWTYTLFIKNAEKFNSGLKIESLFDDCEEHSAYIMRNKGSYSVEILHEFER